MFNDERRSPRALLLPSLGSWSRQAKSSPFTRGGYAGRCILGLIVSFVGACGAPSITSLNPASGPERTLVNVRGDVFLAQTIWDAGAAGEQSVAGGFLGAYVFSVPAGAVVGAHNVAVQRGADRSATSPFTVTAALPFGKPRLDRVSIVGTTFKPGGLVTTWLLVQGANADVGAEVLIDGVVAPSVAWKALRNDLLGVNPTTLGNPIYHHLGIIAASGDHPVGATIGVQLRNLNGDVSDVLPYALPLNATTMDSDGDDIPDEWEIHGYDANGDGTIDVDLPALGANPHRPDILLEVDIMTGLTNNPTPAVFTTMRDAFAHAPFVNVHDSNGIHLILDTSGSIPFSQTTDLTGADNPAAGFANFYTLKTANFNNTNRGRLYHYCIWANMRPNGSSGISDVDWVNGGDDCIVSFDDFQVSMQTVKSMAETLMHEFGHNLNQKHGGENHFTQNPTYNSVMSYSWQLRTGQSNATRLTRPVCTPFYYGTAGAVEVNGALPAAIANVVDYSQGMGRDLVESSLNEGIGVCNNNPIDWNNDGDTADAAASRDVNSDGDTADTHRDFPNWARLKFVGPRLNGSYGT